MCSIYNIAIWKSDAIADGDMASDEASPMQSGLTAPLADIASEASATPTASGACHVKV